MSFDPYFWAAVIGATILKVATSAYHSLWRAMLSVFSAIFCAYVFTDAAVDFLGLNPRTYHTPMAALLALMGESVIRMMLGWAEDNRQLIKDIIRAWRGHK